MELNDNGFLEELLGLKRETWGTGESSSTMSMTDFLTNGWTTSDYFNDNHNPNLGMVMPSSSLEGFDLSTQPAFDCTFGDGPLLPLSEELDMPAFPIQEDISLIENDKQTSLQNLEEMQNTCNVEGVQVKERKNKSRREVGQPSKNLMAERRRRKRLNDRLSMLRSVVPKISKMDRTSILGDTIEYMKELLERIKNLQENIEVAGSEPLNLMGILKDLKSEEAPIRNTPKFNVERRNTDTMVEVCCAGRPGLLLSTVNTLEVLGLEIQQCVISCFNDFAMQASCSEQLEQSTLISPEDIMHALFRNAGYGGRYL
ncbi:hypothetical protein GIB67_017947 [Kingdonia uniflora]|uniref:BHLH domain-containing protein n=1 Tax=Kingdonia uniflora TaxID=39325 RepID=A0A7J7MI12_9MAGN|nr:hypothetical protein GIB67_017947 [Kingdonia uniflora]